jgi:hypothetical protein
MHVTVVFNNNNVKMYKNGNLVGETNSNPAPINVGRPLVIGYSGPTNYRHIDGSIDEVGIWGRALTGPEILNLYTNQLYAPYKE